jgi:hypothetical protein
MHRSSGEQKKAFHPNLQKINFSPGWYKGEVSCETDCCRRRSISTTHGNTSGFFRTDGTTISVGFAVWGANIFGSLTRSPRSKALRVFSAA